MIRLLMVVIVCCWASLCDAQRRNENWVMSDHNWVQFVPGFGPVVHYAPNAFYTQQCNISISDTAGGLQFYGTSQNWQGAPIMPGLFGSDHLLYPGYPDPDDVPNSAGAQGTLVIPQPGNADRYYVIYTGMVASNNYAPACAFLEVDMGLRNGLGDVVSGSFQILSDSTTSHIHGVAHGNGVDYWLLLHRYVSDEFLAFQITANGVASTPIVTAVGPILLDSLSVTIPQGSGLYHGHLTSNTAGDRLVLTSGSGGQSNVAFVEMFNFNNITGALSSLAPIPLDSNVMIGGVEFSPNGNQLYVMDLYHEDPNNPVTYEDNARIWQFDVSSSDPMTIANSKYLVHQKDSVSFISSVVAGLSLAPDQSIYTHYAYTYNSMVDEWLGAITEPDLPGAACDFQLHVVPLLSDDVMSFPNHIKRYNTDFSVDVVEQAQLSVQPSVTFYPNPMRDVCHISLSEFSEATIRVVDAQGRIVMGRQLRKGANYLELERNGIASGSYLLVVEDKDGKRVTRQLGVQ